jgi:hypothetical protein
MQLRTLAFKSCSGVFSDFLALWFDPGLALVESGVKILAMLANVAGGSLGGKGSPPEAVKTD